MRKTVRQLLRKAVATCLIAAMLVGVMPVDMLQMEKVEAASYPSIQLKVPYYPQKSSGDCGISSTAMIEAYVMGYGVSDYSTVYQAVYAANNNSIYLNADNIGYEQISTDLSTMYSQLAAGHPVLIRREPYEHWSVVVGYNGSSSTLEQSGFIVWDTKHGVSACNYNEITTGRKFDLTRWLKAPNWNGSAYVDQGQTSLVKALVRKTGVMGPVDTEAPVISISFYNTGVTNVTNTTAKINAKFATIQPVTECGFYYGTSANNMTKVVESGSTNAEYIYYTLGDGKWCGALSPDTTYYYKIYAVVGGKTYETAVDAFTTSGTATNNPSFFYNTGVTNVTETTAKINAQFASTQAVTQLGFYLGTSPSNMTKVIENGSTNAKYAYYTVGDGKWWGALTPGTTYYYKIYAVVGGTMYETSIDSFTTLGTPPDTTAPTLTNVVISNVDSTGYTITATASDNVGVDSIRFPTKRADQGEDAWAWYRGTQGADGSFTKRINVSEFSNVDGVYQTHVYAYDAAGNSSVVWITEQYIDTTPPVISNAKITNVTGSGYTVECNATDNNAVTKVQFPTWTENNGQDDIASDWYNNSSVSGTANGNVYTFRVKDSAHNFERGSYVTHIYAYDAMGNYSYQEVKCELKNEGTVVVEKQKNGHTYKLIDDKMTWHEAKAACEAMGGHLVTITSAEEQALIESMLQEDTTCNGYFIGGYTEDGVSKWVTGEAFDYSNWYPGQPDGWNGSEVEDVYIICSHRYQQDCIMKWNDIVADAPGHGYICEFEPTPVTALTLSETDTEIGLGKTKTLVATISPAEGIFPDIVWSSANPAIATVSDGVITGVAAGTTTITAECGGKTATCKVKVVKPFESITLNVTDKTLFKNEAHKLEVSFAPADANASKDLVWSSSNPDVATVDDNGVVTAYSAGSAKITAALKNNSGISASCTVQVQSYVVTFDTKGGSNIPNQEYGKDEPLCVEDPIKDGYMFTGWYKDSACTIPWDMENDVVSSTMTLYAGWMEYHEGLWIVEIPDQQYTGKAIKPAVEVYHYAEKLEQGVDYTISYKNNTNACDKSGTKAPTVTVKGKGNYSGKETATFTILTKSLEDLDIAADNLSRASNGKVQKPAPVVTWNNKKLKKDKDYTVLYPDTAPGAYQNNGTYNIRIVGKGNFYGERTIQLQITGLNLVSKVKVSKIANQMYTGGPIEPEFTVKYGSAILTKGLDYTVSYQNNIATGTATAVITGMGSYVGEKKVTFKIVGTSIGKAKVNKLPKTVVYDGTARDDVDYELQMVTADRTVTLVEGEDYTVSYKNNTSAGTATIQFTGINGYTGVLKKTFKILPYNIATDSDKAVDVALAPSIAYTKGGTQIEPLVTYQNKALKPGKDYKLTFKNNKQLSAQVAENKLPSVTISGKGNYSGTITLTYHIHEQNIGLLSMTALDKVYQNKAGKYASTPVIKDVNGKKLTAGTDYEKKVVYTYVTDTLLVDGTVRAAGSRIESTDILPAGTAVKVTAQGKGNYTGEISCIYRIVQADIGKAKGTIDAQVYTGKAITPGKSDITLKIGKTTLAPTDYEIVSYSNNIKKGTATVVVKGVGNYGGTKTIKFKIKSKVFSWWWR